MSSLPDALTYTVQMIRINRRAFQELVSEAITDLPDEFARAMVNVAVVVEEEPTAEEQLEGE